MTNSRRLVFAGLAFATRVIAQSPDQAPQHLEKPDMPPATQTQQRVTSLPATELMQRGPFISVQVNVDANGMNIVNDAANEPSIAVDPTNRNRMAVGY